MNRQLVLLVLGLILTIPVFQSPIFSKQFKPLQGLHVVKSLPLNMVAGSAYEWEVSFVNPKSEEGLMNVTLEVTEEKTVIGFAEFHVEGTLESYDKPPRQHHYKSLNFVEISGGVFNSLQTVDERFNIIKLRISSVPNLMPGKYTFTITITVCYTADMIKSAVDFPRYAVFLDVFHNCVVNLFIHVSLLKGSVATFMPKGSF